MTTLAEREAAVLEQIERLLNTTTLELPDFAPELGTDDPNLVAVRLISFAVDAIEAIDTAKLAMLAAEAITAGLIAGHEMPPGERYDVAELAYLNIHEALLRALEQARTNVRRNLRRASVRYLIPRIGERSGAR